MGEWHKPVLEVVCQDLVEASARHPRQQCRLRYSRLPGGHPRACRLPQPCRRASCPWLQRLCRLSGTWRAIWGGGRGGCCVGGRDGSARAGRNQVEMHVMVRRLQSVCVSLAASSDSTPKKGGQKSRRGRPPSRHGRGQELQANHVWIAFLSLARAAGRRQTAGPSSSSSNDSSTIPSALGRETYTEVRPSATESSRVLPGQHARTHLAAPDQAMHADLHHPWR